MQQRKKEGRKKGRMGKNKKYNLQLDDHDHQSYFYMAMVAMVAMMVMVAMVE